MCDLQVVEMPNFVEKVCPVVLRERDGRVQILAFQHPLAGGQIIKGTLEAGEEPATAVLRELAEESGIEDAVVVEPLGQFIDEEHLQRWHIFLCQVNRPLPDRWSHFTTDGGGHTFRFFWHNLDEPPGDDWYRLFRRAMVFIRGELERTSDSYNGNVK